MRDEKQDVLIRLNALNVNIEKNKKTGDNLITDLPLWDVQSSDVIVNPYS